MSKRAAHAAAAPPAEPWPRRWAWRVVLFSVPAIAWFISPGLEAYRLPKELLLHSEAAILIAFGLAALIAMRRRPALPARDPLLLVLGGIVVWEIVAAIASTNSRLSANAVVGVMACVVVFIATLLLAGARRIESMWAVLLAAIPNAALHALQELRIWNPLFTAEQLRNAPRDTGHIYSTALIGNPDDVGCWFVVPALVAAALLLAWKRWRPLHAALLLISLAVLFTGRSITAMTATAAGLLLMAALVSKRRAAMAAIVIGVAIAVAAIGYAPLRQRVVDVTHLLRAGDYDALLTNRGTPFFAAALMAREHPLAGVGPGTFGFNYYSYKLRVEARHPLLLRSGGREWNFGEVHNDHLQTLATAGLPAYALFLCVAVIFARVSLRPVADDDPRRLFARLFALPFTAAMLIVMLAQFPLQLASTLSIGIFAVATSLAWSRQP